MSIESSLKTITEVLTKLGVDPTTYQLPDSNGKGWAVPMDKSILFVNLGEVDGQPSLRMTCPILFMPTQDLMPFYRKLLDLNSKLIDGALAMDRDTVYIITQQALDGLSSAAVEGLIQRTRKQADVLTDLLIQEFHSARYWRPI